MKGAATEVGLQMKAICTIKKKLLINNCLGSDISVLWLQRRAHHTGRRNTGIYYHNKQAPIKEIINGIVPNIKRPTVPQEAGSDC